MFKIPSQYHKLELIHGAYAAQCDQQEKIPTENIFQPPLKRCHLIILQLLKFIFWKQTVEMFILGSKQ